MLIEKAIFDIKLKTMPKFKIGDRVRNLKATEYVPNGATGTVDENSIVPFVIWDEVTELAKEHNKSNRRALHQNHLELIEQPTAFDTQFNALVNTDKPLTKREQFAMAAMQGLLSICDHQTLVVPNEDNVNYMASLAVKAADALINELNK